MKYTTIKLSTKKKKKKKEQQALWEGARPGSGRGAWSYISEGEQVPGQDRAKAETTGCVAGRVERHLQAPAPWPGTHTMRHLAGTRRRS